MNFEEQMKNVIEDAENTYGQDYFDKTTASLAKAVEADICFIAQLSQDKTNSIVISAYAHGEHLDNFEYALKDTPCAEVTCGAVDIYPKEVCQSFPKDIMLQDMNIEGYVGDSLENSKGDTIGLVVALYHHSIDNGEQIHTLFSFFSGRIAAELDRFEKEKALIELNQNLEETVKERTEALKKTQERIMEQEKFAALGNLVAGIAHEVNTPLGVSITSASLVTSHVHIIQKAIKNKTLTESLLNDTLTSLNEATSILETNLSTAANLIKNFKQVAAEQSNLHVSDFDICETIDSILLSLHPETKKHPVDIQNLCKKAISIKSSKGDFYQILSNLTMNAMKHAFEGKDKGVFSINASLENKELILTIKDDGIGISKDNINKIFNPFFTTKRGQGGTGLGLSIVYNIVTQKLKGNIEVESELGKGSQFIIKIPLD